MKTRSLKCVYRREIHIIVDSSTAVVVVVAVG